MKRIFCLAFLPLLFSSPAVAQDYGARSINFCMMQLGKAIYKYDAKTRDGRLGAYQFDVNALFDAGVCTGAAPRKRTLDWRYCDFRGLTAIDNFIQKPDDIVGRGDTQDLYMQLIRRAIMTRNRDFLLSKEAKTMMRYQNGPELAAALIYRKGLKAVQLLALTNINMLDRDGMSVQDRWTELQMCGGGDRPANMGKPPPLPPPANPNTKVPLEFNWQPVTDKVIKSINAYRKNPLRIVDDLIKNNQLNGLLYDMVDLNGDGKPGMQFMMNMPSYCGTGGCMYVITEDGGALSQNMTTTRIRPAVNGVYANGVYNSF